MADSNIASQKKIVLVLGAGVVGLTTALKIQQQGKYDVVVVGEILPTDSKSIRYTSQWAGAHHVYSTPNEQGTQYKLEAETFKVLWELSAPGSDTEGSFLRLPQTEYYHNDGGLNSLWQIMPEFKQIPEDSLIPGAKSGIQFTTVSIDTPVYLNYLLASFLALGGKSIRGSVQHVNQVIEGGARIFKGAPDLGHAGEPPAAVIVCTGIGSRFLGGVEDTKVYPVRGQTVILRAPWVRFGRTIYKDDTGALTYIIPRRSGDVIVGGTRVANDWFPQPRPETTQDILERGLDLCPELAPPEARSNGKKPQITDLSPIIVGEGCGLRPAREGGVRLEIEWTEGVGRRGKVPLIHNYGHGGAGFQASWGSANAALRLLEEALELI